MAKTTRRAPAKRVSKQRKPRGRPSPPVDERQLDGREQIILGGVVFGKTLCWEPPTWEASHHGVSARLAVLKPITSALVWPAGLRLRWGVGEAGQYELQTLASSLEELRLQMVSALACYAREQQAQAALCRVRARAALRWKEALGRRRKK